MNKRKAKKAANKRGYQPTRTEKRLNVRDVEIQGYIVQAKKANRRISRLQAEGLEPKILTFILSALDADKFPNVSSIGSHDEFVNTFNLLKRFNRNVTSLLKGARREQQEHYSNFVDLLQRATGQALAEDVYKAIYPYLGGIDFKALTTTYLYEEIVNMMYELHSRGVSPTNHYVKEGLDNGIFSALSEYLAQYIPVNFIFDTGDLSSGGVNQIRDFNFYVQYALNNGVRAALAEYESDKNIVELSSYDFLD